MVFGEGHRAVLSILTCPLGCGWSFAYDPENEERATLAGKSYLAHLEEPHDA